MRKKGFVFMKMKSTKRALLMSGLLLLVCVSMLVGSTFAWFTDTVTSAGNKIVAGTLDVQLLMYNGTEYVDISDSDKPIFGAGSIAQNNNAETLWEPGKTQVAYLAIKNNGKLALKYTVALDVTNVSKDLYEVMQYAVTPDAQNGDVTNWNGGKSVVVGNQIVSESSVVMEPGAVHYFALSIHMDENAGNEYQGGEADFDLTVLATQATVESDSFGNQYDAGATYPANISVFTSVADKVNNDNEINQQLIITHQDVSSSVSEVEVVVPQGTKLEDDVTEIVLKIVEKENVDAAVATQITSQQTATTYDISIEGIADDNNAEIEFTLIIEKGLVDVKLYHEGTLIDSNYNPVTGEITFATNGFSPFTVVSATKLFAQGSGTQSDPYIINKAEDLLNISKYYHVYKYYKVADGVKELDLTGIGRIDLNGSFDGNGVKITGLTTSLFKTVGKTGESQKIKISNMDVTVNTTDGHALVRNIYNCGETVFENVKIHGYIEGQYNVGSFYNYGTANSGDSEGNDYTVTFINATSDATLVCTTGNAIGGMLGHAYQGSSYMISINMDASSGYTGTMYSTGTATCYQVMALASSKTYYLNGVEVDRATNVYPSTKLDVVAPTKGADGYYVAPVAGVDHYTVFVNSQLTAYDANGDKITNKSGLTWNLGKKTITADFDDKIFDLFASAEIVNDLAYDLGYALENGVLKIYSARSENYASGWVTLQINQYDANGVLLATGITTIYTFAEP